MSLHAAILTALQTGFGQKRSPCAGCMIRIHSFAEPNFDFVIRFFAPFWCRVFSSWTAQIVPHRALFSVLLVESPFFQASNTPCTNSKKIKKRLSTHYLFHVSSLSAPYRLIPMSYICMFFCFIGSSWTWNTFLRFFIS